MKKPNLLGNSMYQFITQHHYEMYKKENKKKNIKKQKLLRGKYLLSLLEISQTPKTCQAVVFSKGNENTCASGFKPPTYSFQFMFKDFLVLKSFKDISFA